MPRFIDSRLLRETVWAIAEAVLPPIIIRLDRIMALVTVDDALLASLTTLAQTVDSEVNALIAAGKLAPGDVSGIQAALNDANTNLQAQSAPAAPADPSAGDTGTPPVTDPTAPADPSAPVDPTVDAGGDQTAPPADPSAPVA